VRVRLPYDPLRFSPLPTICLISPFPTHSAGVPKLYHFNNFNFFLTLTLNKYFKLINYIKKNILDLDIIKSVSTTTTINKLLII